MIKRWSKFNESNSVDNFKSIVEDIRSYFIEFEDMNVVSYEMKVFGSTTENDMLWSINPNTGNFDNWLRNLLEEANGYLNNDNYRKLFLRGEDKLDKYPFCLDVKVKLKGESEVWGASCHLSEKGIDMLEDLLVTYKRLKSSYEKITINLNSNHQDYKPATVRVYFNPIVD